MLMPMYAVNAVKCWQCCISGSMLLLYKKISTGNLKRHSDTSPCLITSDKPFEHKVYVSNCPKPKALAI